MIVCGSFGDCQHTDLGGFLFGNITALKPTEEPLVDFNAFAPFDCFIISALRTVENCECIVGGLVPKSLCSTEGHHETTISGYALFSRRNLCNQLGRLAGLSPGRDLRNVVHTGRTRERKGGMHRKRSNCNRLRDGYELSGFAAPRHEVERPVYLRRRRTMFAKLTLRG